LPSRSSPAMAYWPDGGVAVPNLVVLSDLQIEGAVPSPLCVSRSSSICRQTPRRCVRLLLPAAGGVWAESAAMDRRQETSEGDGCLTQAILTLTPMYDPSSLEPSRDRLSMLLARRVIESCSSTGRRFRAIRSRPSSSGRRRRVPRALGAARPSSSHRLSGIREVGLDVGPFRLMGRPPPADGGRTVLARGDGARQAPGGRGRRMPA